MIINRFKIPFFIIVLSFAFAFPAMAIPTINLNLVNEPSAVGDTFDVEVRADGDDMGLGLLFFGFDVAFDSGGIFDYTGYTLGTEFGSDDIEDIDIAASSFPAVSDNNVLLATLSFSVVALGTDTLRVIGLYDGLFSGLYYELNNGDLVGYDINQSLTITSSQPQPSPVPEPSSMFLLSTGLAAALGCRRLRYLSWFCKNE